MGKGLDPNVQPRKQILKPIAVIKVKEVSQIKPRLGQRRACLRHKIKMPVSSLISKAIVQVSKKPVEQSKVLVPETYRMFNKIIPNYAILI